MKTTKVSQLMIPLGDYATVPQEATLLEAVLALEKAQLTLDPSRHKHRAILVLDGRGKVMSKITMKNILILLEPNYGRVNGGEVLERLGHSPDLVRSMLVDDALWTESSQFFRKRAASLKLRDVVQAPSEGEYIDANASLGEAIHQLIVYPYHSLLVTSDEEVTGVLRLSDVFAEICDIIKGTNTRSALSREQV